MSNQKKPTSEESVGHITSDSLAAQSLRSGGDFASGDATPHGVPSKSTTANVTDTSGATTLPPAPDAPSRDTPDEPYMQPGTTSASGTDTGASGVYDTSKGGPQASDAGAAPSYVHNVTGAAHEAQTPKGRNLTEGGFDPDLPNASFQGDIGTSRDPGRLREAELAAANARSGDDAGAPDSSVAGVGGKGGFEALGERRA